MRLKRLDQHIGLGDRFAEWLIRHIPLTTLALLGLVVMASVVTFERPWIIVAAAGAGDAILGVSRRARRPRGAESARFGTRVAA